MIVTAKLASSIDYGDFIEITASPVVRIEFVGMAGEVEVEFAGDLTPAEVVQAEQRIQSRNGNELTLRMQARTALQNNRDFLAIASPTNAQTLAQVRALSRQNNGAIRMLLGQLDGTN